MRLKPIIALLIAVPLVQGQPGIGQYHNFVERIRMISNNVTDADLDRAEKNADWVRDFLGKTWSLLMLLRGHNYNLPLLIDGGRAYAARIPWKCETGTVVQFDNAEYCPASNTISYDGFFLAGLGKKVATQTHSPGDFATIMALAHEHGHALQHQLGIASVFAFQNEQNADCFAGATTYQMKSAGQLRPTDLAEATAAWTLLADDRPAKPTDNAHGDASQRIAAFMWGYVSGPEGCAASLKPLPTPWRPPH